MSYLGVEYYLFHSNIIGFIVGFIITLLVSYVWKVCNETTLPFIDSIFLCSLFTRHHQSISKNNHFNFFLVLDLMNCCKFQKPMTKPIRKRALLNKNYEIKCLNTRWCFTSTKRIYPKWRYLTYCWYWCHKNTQKIALHYRLNYCLQ